MIRVKRTETAPSRAALEEFVLGALEAPYGASVEDAHCKHVGRVKAEAACCTLCGATRALARLDEQLGVEVNSRVNLGDHRQPKGDGVHIDGPMEGFDRGERIQNTPERTHAHPSAKGLHRTRSEDHGGQGTRARRQAVGFDGISTQGEWKRKRAGERWLDVRFAAR